LKGEGRQSHRLEGQEGRHARGASLLYVYRIESWLRRLFGKVRWQIRSLNQSRGKRYEETGSGGVVGTIRIKKGPTKADIFRWRTWPNRLNSFYKESCVEQKAREKSHPLSLPLSWNPQPKKNEGICHSSREGKSGCEKKTYHK